MKRDKETYLLFVYGTLKKGKRNEAQIKNEIFVGDCKTVEKYPLIQKPGYYYPHLLNKKDEGFEIPGELYVITKQTLDRLDCFEGKEYYADEILVYHNANIVTAITYFTIERTYNKDYLIKEFS